MNELSLSAGSFTGAQPIVGNFVGVSMEWSTSVSYSSQPAFATLLSQISPHPSIRVGGNSADTTWWPEDGHDNNETCTNSYNNSVCCKTQITAEGVATHAALAKATDGTLTLDLNLLDASGAYALQEYTNINSAIGSDSDFIEAFEIGNEPDLFYENGIRSPDYTLEDYMKDFDAAVAQLPAEAKLQGGTFCCNSDFAKAQSDVINK